MNLWLLRPIDLPAGGPWDPWYDKAFGFVVRASTELDARNLADKEAGDENCKLHPWLDPNCSTCIPLASDGEAGVIIRDFAAA